MNTLMERLMRFAPPGGMENWEYPLVRSEIENLKAKGWTDDEVIAKLRWMEHVNPVVDEDTALRNMRAVNERVALRIRNEH